ncbi:MAG: hypothetical protein ACLTNK_00715 [Akkermansia muciniphila]
MDRMPVTTSIMRVEKGSARSRSTEKMSEISQEKESAPVRSSRPRERTKVARQEKVEVRAATSGRLVSRNQSKAATTSGRKSRSQVY